MFLLEQVNHFVAFMMIFEIGRYVYYKFSLKQTACVKFDSQLHFLKFEIVELNSYKLYSHLPLTKKGKKKISSTDMRPSYYEQWRD